MVRLHHGIPHGITMVKPRGKTTWSVVPYHTIPRCTMVPPCRNISQSYHGLPITMFRFGPYTVPTVYGRTLRRHCRIRSHRSHVCRRHAGLHQHISTPATDHVDAMDRLATCIERIRDWIADNHLKLNEEKTQIIWLGTHQQLNKVTTRALTLPNATVEFSTTVKDLGVVLDSQVTMADHIAALR